MEYQLGECKSCDALADQIAELTKTNLEQAAQIEAYLTVLERLAKLGNEPHYGNSLGNEIARKALSTPPSQALADFATKVREQCYQAVQPEDSYQDEWFKAKVKAVEQIRNLKELP